MSETKWQDILASFLCSLSPEERANALKVMPISLICRKGFGFVLVIRHGQQGNPMYPPPAGSHDQHVYSSPNWEHMEAKIETLETEYKVKCVCANFKPPS